MARTFEAKVLDHGSIILRNLASQTHRHQSLHWVDNEPVVTQHFGADDIDPAQAARMSFEQMDTDRTYEQEMKLAKYLWVNGHSSPFEMIQVWLEVKVPIFVDRQFVRHRVWRRNESSGRYIVLPDKWYIPEVVGGKAADKKQGQEDNLDPILQQAFKISLNSACRQDYAAYIHYLERGVAPEHARMFLHLNHYVHWLGNVDLGNLFKFLALRTHNHAQIEAQVYGESIVGLLRPHLPGLMGLFDEVVRKK